MILDTIVGDKKNRLNTQKKVTPLYEMRMRAEKVQASAGNDRVSFYHNLSKDGISIIGEFKKASPSAGDIKSTVDLKTRIAEYNESVDAISCLTEEDHFKGSVEYLEQIRSKTKLPILRKDFMVDEYQFYEAKVIGADAILLICAILDDFELKAFYQLSDSLGLDALVECHSEDEVERALELGAEIIGVNNRNLKDFTISLDTTRKLKKYIPDDKIIFISTPNEILLFKEINLKHKDKNIIYSPIGVEILLSLCTNGSEGDTKKEILDFLKYKDTDEANKNELDIINKAKSDKGILNLANLILTKIRVDEQFIKNGQKYDSKIEELKNERQVNTWCKKQTNGKIPKIIDKVSPNTKMLLLNAIYFESKWNVPFLNSIKKNFFNYGKKDKISRVDMMNSEIIKRPYLENEKCQVVKLEYVNKQFESIVVLPKENIDIETFIKDLDYIQYKNIISELKPVKVDLSLPKFKIEFGPSLKGYLVNLGVKKCFSTKAEFKGISKKTSLFFNDIIQKTFINVNEDGTQAAAVTMIEMGETFPGEEEEEKIYSMVVNRPFLFIIRKLDNPEGRDIIFISKITKL